VSTIDLGETERHRAGVTSSCTLIRPRFVKGQQIGSEVDAEEQRDKQYTLHTKHTGSMEMSLDIRLETEWIMEKKYRNIKPDSFSMWNKSKETDF